MSNPKMKARKSDVREFVAAVYGTKMVDLALTTFSERECLQEATKRINQLEVVVTALLSFECDALGSIDEHGGDSTFVRKIFSKARDVLERNEHV